MARRNRTDLTTVYINELIDFIATVDKQSLHLQNLRLTGQYFISTLPNECLFQTFATQGVVKCQSNRCECWHLIFVGVNCNETAQNKPNAVMRSSLSTSTLHCLLFVKRTSGVII